MSEWVDCKHLFSNGTEFEWFLDTQCFNGCKLFRNGKCRIYNAICYAMIDKNKFPYDDLLENAKWYAGMKCKSYTTEAHRSHTRRPIRGQIALELGGNT